MRRWCSEWAAPLLVVVIGLAYLAWSATTPVSPSGPTKLRTDKTRQVVIPQDSLMDHPVWLTIEMDMTPPIMIGQEIFTRGLRYQACVRNVSDIPLIRQRALTWAGEPRASVRRFVWTPITLRECLLRPWTSGALS